MNKSIPVTSACDKPQTQTPWLNVQEAIKRMTSAVKKLRAPKSLPFVML